MNGSKKDVLTLAWPLAIGMFSYTLMGLVDTLLMGRVSTVAQAGVGLAATFGFVAISFFRGLTSGAQSLVAAADGAGDRVRVRQAGTSGVVAGLVSGIVVLVGLSFFAREGLRLLVDDPAIAGAAQDYLSVFALGMPFTLVGVGALAGLQGLGDTKARMWVSLVGNVVNAALDVVFIFGFGPVPALGARGAALASVIGAIVMGALYLARYRQRFERFEWPAREVFQSGFAVGLPAGLQGVLGMSAFVVIDLVLARAGAVHLAASEIVLRVASISFLPGFGVSEAGGVLVGRYLGAKAKDSAIRSVRSARVLAFALMGTCGLMFALFGDRIASLFSQDATVVSLAGTLMLFAASFQVFDAVAMVHLCALRGAGDTRFCLLVTTIATWGVTVPCVLFFGLYLGWGAPGAWLGLSLEIALLALITGRRVGGLETGRVGRLDLLLGT